MLNSILRRRTLLLFSAAALAPNIGWTAPSVSTEMIRRSQVSLGDPRRLQAVFDKAQNGGEIVLAVLGGSISTGSLASRPENGYPALVEAWWQREFPQASFRTVRAGVAGTGSLFGALRLDQDVLSQTPDVVIVEFAVNDAWTDQEPFESIVRSLLSASSSMAVMLLFMSYDNGHNEQAWQQTIGAHYGLPMVSFRDAVWPEIEAGRLRAADVLVDIVHPNDRGHALTAELITASLQAQRAAPALQGAPASIPSPAFGERYSRATWQPADQLSVVDPAGWRLTRNDNLHPILLGKPVWLSEATTPLEVRWQGSGVVAMMMLANDDPRPVALAIDGQERARIELSTQPRRPIVTVALDLPVGAHTLRLQRDAGAGDTPAFGLFGIGVLP